MKEMGISDNIDSKSTYVSSECHATTPEPPTGEDANPEKLTALGKTYPNLKKLTALGKTCHNPENL